MFKENQNLERFIVTTFLKIQQEHKLGHMQMGAVLRGKDIDEGNKSDEAKWRRIIGKIGNKHQKLGMDDYFSLCEYFKLDIAGFMWEIKKEFKTKYK